jgi:ABC-2 type transport system permease protein
VLRRWWASPLPRSWFFAARIAATVLLTVAGAAVTVAAAAFYHLQLDVTAAGSPLLTIVLGTLCWAALGTAATVLIPTADSAQPLLALTFYPLMLLSGALGSASDRAAWLTAVLRWLPAQPMIDAAGHALRQGVAPYPPSHDVAVLAAWAVAGLLGSLSFFRWHPR